MTDYITLKNEVFAQYYQNAFLPGSLGGADNTSIFQMILTVTSLLNQLSFEMEVSKVWAGEEVTWFTSSLPDLFFVPKFVGESDQDYLDRILLLQENGQDATTITNAVFTVVRNALDSINQIEIVDRLAGVSAVWGNEGVNEPDAWNDGSVWGSEVDVQRVMFIVKIEFFEQGSTTDNSTYDYWQKSENYSKIEDIVKLYKPPGSTFELLLLGLGREVSVTAETNIKTPTTTTLSSDTTIA